MYYAVVRRSSFVGDALNHQHAVSSYFSSFVRSFIVRRSFVVRRLKFEVRRCIESFVAASSVASKGTTTVAVNVTVNVDAAAFRQRSQQRGASS